MRLVFVTERAHESQSAAIRTVAEKVGCSPETLRRWVRKAEQERSTVRLVSGREAPVPGAVRPTPVRTPTRTPSPVPTPSATPTPPVISTQVAATRRPAHPEASRPGLVSMLVVALAVVSAVTAYVVNHARQDALRAAAAAVQARDDAAEEARAAVRARTASERETTLTLEQRDRARAEAHRIRQRLVVSAAGLLADDPMTRVAVLREVDAEDPAAVPGWATLAAESADVPSIRIALPRAEGGASGATIAPGGEWVVTTSPDGGVQLAPTDGSGPSVALTGHAGRLARAAFSPDGRSLVSWSDDGTAQVWHTDEPREVAQLLGHEGAIRHAVFSPDGREVLTASGDGTARLWTVDGSAEPVVMDRHDGPVLHAAFDPRGELVVTASTDGTARVWTVAGAEVGVYREHRGVVRTARFGPDGARIVTASGDGTAHVWRADGTGTPVVLEGHTAGVVSATFSPDGRTVASGVR